MAPALLHLSVAVRHGKKTGGPHVFTGMGTVELEEILRRLAVVAVQDGRLPACKPAHMWGGGSSGSHCALCFRKLESWEQEVEVEFATNHESTPGSLLFHVHCHAAWEAALAV